MTDHKDECDAAMYDGAVCSCALLPDEDAEPEHVPCPNCRICLHCSGGDAHTCPPPRPPQLRSWETPRGRAQSVISPFETGDW